MLADVSGHSGTPQLFPQCLGLYGDWLAETQSENPSLIMENYLSKVQSLSLASTPLFLIFIYLVYSFDSDLAATTCTTKLVECSLAI